MSTLPPPKSKTVPRWLDLSKAFPVGGSLRHPKYVEYRDKTGVLDAAITLANANSQKDEPGGKFDRCVLRWTAGGPLLPYDDYHYCQVMDTDDEPAIIRCVAPWLGA